jgi:hypothetical protein
VIVHHEIISKTFPCAQVPGVHIWIREAGSICS